MSWSFGCGGWPCGCGGDTYGYISGGQFGGFSLVTDKIAFTAESVNAITTANLSVARGQYPAGAVNPSVAAYFAGGLTAALTASAITDKLVFSSDTTSAATTANLANTQSGLAGLSERSSKAYFAGGSTTGNAATNITANAHKLTFSGDSTSAATTANLSQARKNLVGLTDGSTNGYWAGGTTSSVGSQVVTAEKLVFSSDTTSATTTANLSQARYDSAAVSDGGTYGYICGGDTGAGVGTVDRLTFATDTTAIRTSMALNRWAGAGMSNGTLGIVGGFDGVNSNAMSKITFATEVVSTATGTLSASRNYYGAAAQAGL